MSEKVLESCNYCGHTHAQDKEPLMVAGIPVKTCPIIPKDEIRLSNKSRVAAYMEHRAEQLRKLSLSSASAPKPIYNPEFIVEIKGNLD